MAAPRIRKLIMTQEAVDFVALQEGDDLLPWDVIKAKIAELLRFLASALPALVAGLREWAAALARLASAAFAVALPAAAVVALLVVCCCGYYAACGRRRRRGPDGEEEADGAGCDGPVVRYGGGAYRGGIFSMHPNKPIVC